MKRTIALVALALAAPGLSACNALFGSNGSSSGRLSSADVDLADYFADRIAMGRTLMDRQRYGAALVAFRQARYHPDYAGDAYNGMAVAYVKLGRADLAERFFLEASRADPGNPRYMANLSHLRADMAQMAVASKAAAQPAEAPAPSGVLAAAARHEPRLVDTGRAVIRMGLPQTKLMRAGASAVFLASSGESVAPATQAAKSLVTVSDPAPSRSVVQVSGRMQARISPAVKQQDYPVRAAIASRPATVRIVTSPAASQSAVAYPQRVAIGR
ncbi:MAG: tetratricopeptide repeat protein [Novosphingobium sp.]|nr:tetratricopeptide repeat protein [Novosphingobium sp.]